VTAPGTARPLRIGLTGPIGCGKSTVARFLASRGAVVIDADALARDATAPGEPAFRAIVERFGPAVLAPDGRLDRPTLARIVFADAAALHGLEEIVHPAVRPRVMAALGRAGPAGSVVVLEAIRLVEAGYAAVLDEIWLVTCDPATQRARLVDRGLDPADAERRIASQAGLVDRARPVTTRLLPTDGTLAETEAVVMRSLEEARAALHRASD
jgi:dephospho-CoA kinase